MRWIWLTYILIPFSIWATDPPSNKNCSQFLGGEVGEMDFYLQLCYDSTFYYHEWHASGREIFDEGGWWFNREDETIVLYSETLQKGNHAYYESNRTKGYLFDSIPFPLRNGMIYLFEEDWDTLDLIQKKEFSKRVLSYMVIEEIDSVEIKEQDSIRKLGPFHQNPIYQKLFTTEGMGLMALKAKLKERKEHRKQSKDEKREAKFAMESEKALEEAEKSAKDRKKKQSRLEYIKEQQEKRMSGEL